ncbi:MAG: aspartate 1-decarboxylase [Thermodesulfobacteriota bacterium]|nr:aspartate 1-decarboxylase [Thermodesulfobacteriota bacterium]
MRRIMLKSKIHRATVTGADLNYEGSVSIDATLMREADIISFEAVRIYNISNGERFETYAIEGEANSGTICLNGAAARKVSVGDLIIIASYAHYNEEEAMDLHPKLVFVDKENRKMNV